MKTPLIKIYTHSDVSIQFYTGKVKSEFCGINLYLIEQILY